MPRQATIRYVSLRNSLVNLPLSLYAPLVEHRVLFICLGTSRGRTSRCTWDERLSAASSLALRGAGASETVEIDPQYAASLGLAEGTLELHANYIEESMLSQVRVAAVGQEVDAWVLGRTRVRFRVVSTDPPGPCMLSTDTEVSIAPKSRALPHPAPRPTATEPIASTSASSSSKPGVPLRVVPASLVKGLLLPGTSTSEATLLVAPHTLESLSLASSVLVRPKTLRPPFTLSKPSSATPSEQRPFYSSFRLRRRFPLTFHIHARCCCRVGSSVARRLVPPTTPRGTVPLSLFSHTGGSKGDVAVIATAKSTANLHPLLATSHLFGLHLWLKSPGPGGRYVTVNAPLILATLISSHLSTSSHLELDPTEPPNYVALAGMAKGYSVQDLEDLVKRSVTGYAVVRARGELTLALSERDFEIAQRDFVPLLFNMPDGDERSEILRVVARKVSLSPDVDLSDYTTQTEQYSGANLHALVYNAHLDAVHETMLLPQSSDTGSGNGQDGRSVRVKQFGAGEVGQKSAAEETALQRRMAAMMNPRRSGTGSPAKPMTNGAHAAPMPKIEVHDGHLLKALRGMKPSLPADERARLDWIYAKFSSDSAIVGRWEASVGPATAHGQPSFDHISLCSFPGAHIEMSPNSWSGPSLDVSVDQETNSWLRAARKLSFLAVCKQQHSQAFP